MRVVLDIVPLIPLAFDGLKGVVERGGVELPRFAPILFIPTTAAAGDVCLNRIAIGSFTASAPRFGISTGPSLSNVTDMPYVPESSRSRAES